MDQNPSESSSTIRETRRRRTRSLIVPEGRTERAIYVNDVAKRLVPGLDFYLLSLLCGTVLAAGILLDHPAIYILAALAAPFMTPLVGLGFSTAVGSFRFFMQSLGGLAIGSALVFLMGAVGGWISKLFLDLPVNQASYHITFSIPDLLLVSVGTVLAVYMTVKSPKKRSLVASVALAYEVYLPVGVAGFGLTSGLTNFFSGALRMAGINILIVLMLGSVVLVFFRLRPSTFFGYLLTAAMLGAAAYGLYMSSAVRTSLQPQVTKTIAVQTEKPVAAASEFMADTPQPSGETMVSTPTNTLVPTRTPTVTNTPRPPDVFASINEPQGVYMRENPCTDDGECPKVIPAVSNKTLVRVLARTEDGQWFQVETGDGLQGWILGSYLLFQQ